MVDCFQRERNAIVEKKKQQPEKTYVSLHTLVSDKLLTIKIWVKCFFRGQCSICWMYVIFIHSSNFTLALVVSLELSSVSVCLVFCCYRTTMKSAASFSLFLCEKKQKISWIVNIIDFWCRSEFKGKKQF